MCGRLAQATAIRKTQALLDIINQLELPARFNVAPSLPLAVVRAGAHGLEWALPRWGLIPHWAKDPKTGYKMINAKAETVATKPAYRGPLRYHRCLIPADGFYEWHTENKLKQPYYIKFRDDQPMLFAGLWDRWQGPEQTLETCTIITTDANAVLSPVHHRMPVIIAPGDALRWLDSARQRPEDIEELLRPFSPENMQAYRVDPRVNKPVFDNEECIKPISGE